GGSYQVLCATTNDTLTVSGVDILQCPTSASASATCAACCTPAIKVYKQVVCYTSTGCDAFSPVLTDQKSATGIKINPDREPDCPAFCYSVVVSNIGNVTLNNLTVGDVNLNDTHNLNLSSCAFPTSLAPGTGFRCVTAVTTNHCAINTN